MAELELPALPASLTGPAKPAAAPDVPPASDNFDFAGALKDGMQSWVAEQTGQPGNVPPDPEPLTEDRSQPPAPPTDVNVPPVDSQPPVQAFEPPKQRQSDAVPYERFVQVNTENLRLTEEARQAREHSAAIEKAAAAGYQSVAEYQQADAYAKRNNYASVESMQIANRAASQLQEFEKTLSAQVLEGELSENVKSMMVQQQATLLATQAMLQEQRQQQQFTQTQLVEQAITNAHSKFASFGIPMAPDFEATLRTMNPVDIGRMTDTQVTYIKQVISNSNGQYAATKLAQQQQRTPMGSQGAPPPPPRQLEQRRGTNENFDPATGTFMDAMGFDPNRTGPDWETFKRERGM